MKTKQIEIYATASEHGNVVKIEQGENLITINDIDELNSVIDTLAEIREAL